MRTGAHWQSHGPRRMDRMVGATTQCARGAAREMEHAADEREVGRRVTQHWRRDGVRKWLQLRMRKAISACAASCAEQLHIRLEEQQELARGRSERRASCVHGEFFSDEPSKQPKSSGLWRGIGLARVKMRSCDEEHDECEAGVRVVSASPLPAIYRMQCQAQPNLLRASSRTRALGRLTQDFWRKISGARFLA